MWPHLDDPRSIARYDERPHVDVHLTREARLDLAPEAAPYLPANNYTARIAYAEVATAAMTRFTKALPRSTPVFWVTLVRDTYTVPYDRAADLSLFKLQQWARAELPGCSFIGMVEAALYTNAGEVRLGWTRAVSWHAHLLVWGASKQQLREIRDSLNVRVRTLIPGVKAAHFRTLKPEAAEGQVLYMLKAPVNEYRIIPDTRQVVDPATGQKASEATGAFSSKKYPLGPGDLVRMANLLSGKRLDELAFAAGEGRAVLRQINAEARTAERALVELKRAREASRRSMAAAQVRRRRR